MQYECLDLRNRTRPNRNHGPVPIGNSLAAALDNLGEKVAANQAGFDPYPARKKIAGSFHALKDRWLRAVARYPNLSGADYAVVMAISTYLNSRSGVAWPSIKRLANDINRDQSMVWRSINRLEKFNLLEVSRARGRNRPNRYRPLFGESRCDPKTLRRRKQYTANSQ
jgi:DNA-binding MarR family transcriptional regulator